MPVCLVVLAPKLFYHPDCDLKFSEYGIEIPIVDDRASRIFFWMQTQYSDLQYTNNESILRVGAEDILLAHSAEYTQHLFGSYSQLEKEMMACYELVDQEGHFHRYNPQMAQKDFSFAFETILNQVGMTYLSTKEALRSGFSYFLGGGMHHAMSFSGRGFCLVNDIVITLRKLQQERLIQKAWVIDVDAHKGDGTAEITKADSTIATLSIHMKEGWPLDSGSEKDPWFIPSNIDIEMGIGEEACYLDKLKMGLVELEKNYARPDLVIIVNGADPYKEDALLSTVNLKLSKEQLLLRDQMIYEFLKEKNIPQSYVMAGGYGKRSWEIYTQFLEFVWKDSSKRSEVRSR